MYIAMIEGKKLQDDRLLHKKVRSSSVNTVKERRRIVGEKCDLALLQKANKLWDNMDEFRKQAERAYMYVYGDQWGETMTVNGETMTQREYLERHGNIALQTNQIKSKVNAIVGLMLKERNEPVALARDRGEQQYGEVATSALQANCAKNKMESIYSACIKDLTIRGMCVEREDYCRIGGRDDAWSFYIDPYRFIIDTAMSDPRFWDMSLVGTFYDIEPGALAARFANASEASYRRLREIYPPQFDIMSLPDACSFGDTEPERGLDFWIPTDRSKCRVYEIWTKESKARYRVHDQNLGTLEVIDADDTAAVASINAENERRSRLGRNQGLDASEIPYIECDFFMDSFWYCRYLAPTGEILWEGESTLADRSQPFTICATPFTGGRIQSYISDAIDHQILINRTIILQDWLVRAQAKGVTVVPKQLVPKDVSLQEFAASWTSMGDLVFIDWKPGVSMPQTLKGNAVDFNAAGLLNEFRTLMEDSMAVSGALQGKTPYSGTSAALYAQQTRNASTPIFSFMTKFRQFQEDVSTKKLKNILHFYDSDRFVQIAGSVDGIADPSKMADVADVEYDLSIKENTETPVYRMVANDVLMQLLQLGQITGEELLEFGSFPFADRILQSRRAKSGTGEVSMDSQSSVQQPHGSLPRQSPAMADLVQQLAQ